MLTELDSACKKCFDNLNDDHFIYQYYSIFLRTMLYVPIHKSSNNSIENFKPLTVLVKDNPFMLGFDSLEKYKEWASDSVDEIDTVCMLGQDLIAGLRNDITLGINLGTEFYKEFHPDELNQLRVTIGKIRNSVANMQV